MRLPVRSLALLSGLRIRHCRELWCRLQMRLDPALLWLWCRPVATAPILPLAWEPPYAAKAALEMAKRQKKKKKVNRRTVWEPQGWRDCTELSSGQGLVGREGWIGREQDFLGQWKYSVGYCNNGYMLFYICPASPNVWHQEWALVKTVGFQWLWCVSAVSSIVQIYHLVRGVDGGGGCVCGGRG